MMQQYINKKKDIKEEISKPFADIEMKFALNLLFFFEAKNWNIAKNKDSQSKKFPKKGAIIKFIILLFQHYKN